MIKYKDIDDAFAKMILNRLAKSIGFKTIQPAKVSNNTYCLVVDDAGVVQIVNDNMTARFVFVSEQNDNRLVKALKMLITVAERNDVIVSGFEMKTTNLIKHGTTFEELLINLDLNT